METRRAFGTLFVGVAVAVFSGAFLSELAYLIDAPTYYYGAIWLGSFGATFGAAWPKFRKSLPAIRVRMKNSICWPRSTKALNAMCWILPFVSIIVFPALYQYMILLGIGLGNMATYAMMKKNSGLDNREQLIVATISLAALPLAIIIDTSLFIERQDIALMLSRLFIALSYGAGGVYALRARN